MDMRTHGKDFEKYYVRAEKESGVRFIRSRIHSLDPDPETGNIHIRYMFEDGTIQVEEFHLVVLSCGLEISPTTLKLAENLGVAITPETRFAWSSPFAPVNTNKPGIFVCGAFQGPKDIPTSVMEASAAAAAAGELLAAARGTELKVKELPPETGRRGPGAARRRLRLQLRHQHRRRHQRPGPHRIRGHPAGGDGGRPEPVHLFH